MVKTIDVPIGATIHMECNYCKVSDDLQPKLWFYKKRGSDSNSIKEIDVAKFENTTFCKLSLTTSHRLDLHDFRLSDSGVYICKRYGIEEDTAFSYFVDAIFDNVPLPKFGKISQWQEYKRTRLDLINREFGLARNEPFASFKNNFSFTFRLITVWDSWELCESHRNRNKICRTRLGRCRLHPFLNDVGISKNDFQNIESMTKYYLEDNYDVSCYSITLNENLPELSKILRTIPNFMLTENCDTITTVTKHIGENSHITLTCPEVSLDSKVEWYKDKTLLNSSFRKNMAETEEEPHITIDSYNALYILHASKNEEGIYKCVVDGEKIQSFDVKVVSKSKLLNQEFIRYSIYLGFILSLTLTCYCAGMCVAWHRRSSFADPLNLKRNHRHDNSEVESLLSP